MPIVRLSGTVTGKTDPRRKERAELIYHLFATGWDIYNGNGDQTTHLENIQKKIIESDAFVFTPNPTLEDYFNLTSLFVGFQTLDEDLKNKPTIIVNTDGSWDVFLNLIEHLYTMGTVKERWEQYITIVKNVDDLVKILGDKEATLDTHQPKKAHKEPDIIEAGTIIHNDKIKMPKFNVCVFCSASIRKEKYLEEGYNMGKGLAAKGWGCISGAGKTGIMGSVVKGANENDGWSGGSNVPHIIRLEGLPDGLNEFWPRSDIYTRMEIMIENSDAFVVMPGGMGTVQELLAMLILKHHKNDSMKGKKIVIFNKFDRELKKNFWDPAIEIITAHGGFTGEYEVVDNIDEIFRKLEPEAKK